MTSITTNTNRNTYCNTNKQPSPSKHEIYLQTMLSATAKQTFDQLRGLEGLDMILNSQQKQRTKPTTLTSNHRRSLSSSFCDSNLNIKHITNTKRLSQTIPEASPDNQFMPGFTVQEHHFSAGQLITKSSFLNTVHEPNLSYSDLEYPILHLNNTQISGSFESSYSSMEGMALHFPTSPSPTPKSPTPLNINRQSLLSKHMIHTSFKQQTSADMLSLPIVLSKHNSIEDHPSLINNHSNDMQMMFDDECIPRSECPLRPENAIGIARSLSSSSIISLTLPRNLSIISIPTNTSNTSIHIHGNSNHSSSSSHSKVNSLININLNNNAFDSNSIAMVSKELPTFANFELSLNLKSINTDSVSTLNSGGCTWIQDYDEDEDIEIIIDDVEEAMPFPEEDFLICGPTTGQDMSKNAFNDGNGASGIIYKGFHFQSCKMVAMKCCRSRKNVDESAFLREANLYREFAECSSIVDIMGSGKLNYDGKLCLALEYMTLKSLEQPNLVLFFARNEHLVSYISKRVLIALCALHAKLYVHNDVKPHNILCNENADIKLSDFGCVLKMVDGPLEVNNGTELYQSPEKLVVSPIRYTTKSDIWSFGITMYEVLFGTVNTTTKDVNYALNPPLIASDSGMSRICCDFINKCLIRDPNKRPSAQQLLEHAFITRELNNTINIDCTDDNSDSNKHLSYTSNFLSPNQSSYTLSLSPQWKNLISPLSTMSISSNSGLFSPSNDMKQNIKYLVPNNTPTPNALEDDNNILYNSGSIHNSVGSKNAQNLKFMVGALLFYYSRQKFDWQNNHSHTRRRSNSVTNNLNVGKLYTDKQRIENMSLYCGYSSSEIVRYMRATVAVIKMRLSKIGY